MIAVGTFLTVNSSGKSESIRQAYVDSYTAGVHYQR